MNSNCLENLMHVLHMIRSPFVYGFCSFIRNMLLKSGWLMWSLSVSSQLMIFSFFLSCFWVRLPHFVSVVPISGKWTLSWSYRPPSPNRTMDLWPLSSMYQISHVCIWHSRGMKTLFVSAFKTWSFFFFIKYIYGI